MLLRLQDTFRRSHAIALLAPVRSARLLHRSAPLFALVRKPFLLADIGEGITECEIVKWLVEKDQVVEEFDPVVEVMSDKATVEITSPYSGRILELNGAVGDVVKVGKQLLEVEVEDGSTGSSAETSSFTTSPSISASQSSSIPSDQPSGFKEVHSERSRTDVLATPSTRRIARETGISLNDVSGTGKDGRVTKGDVLKFVNSGGGVATPTFVSPPAPSQIAQSAPKQSPVISHAKPIPLSPIRKAMYKSMATSLSIPHFAYSEVLDITELERLRLVLNERVPLEYRKTLGAKEENELARRGAWSGLAASETGMRVEEHKRFDKITLLPLLIKAMAVAMDQNPLFKCLLSPTAASGSTEDPVLVPQPSSSISVAFSASPEGLFLPTIASVSTLSPFDIASQLSHLSSITPFSPPPAYRSPASFTISNIGAIGGRTTHPVVPPVSGQLGIVAIGRQRVEELYLPGQEKAARQAALEGESGAGLKKGPRILMDATFTADHRVVEGVELARFAEAWKRVIEAPGLLSGIGA